MADMRQEAGVNIRVGPDKYVRQARVNLRHFLCARRADTEVLLLRQVMHTNLSRYQLVGYLSSLRGHRPTLLRGRRVPEGRLDSAAPAVRSTTDPDRPLVGSWTCAVRLAATLSVYRHTHAAPVYGLLKAAAWANSARVAVQLQPTRPRPLYFIRFTALYHVTYSLRHARIRGYFTRSLGRWASLRHSTHGVHYTLQPPAPPLPSSRRGGGGGAG